MASIINKRTPEIMASRRPKGINFVTVTDKGLYFPKQTAFLVGLKEGQHVHFINDGDYWAFFINADTDGFAVTNNNGYMVCNRTLPKMFVRSIKKKMRDRFYVVPTNSEKDGCRIWEIYTKDTVEVVIEKQKRIAEQKNYVLSLTPQKVKRQKNAEAYDGK